MDDFSRQPAPEILQRFDFTDDKSPESVVAEFVKAARIFAGVSKTDLVEKSRVTAGSYEIRGHLRDATDNGVLLSTLITITRACGLNMAVIIAPKNARVESEKPFLFSKNDSYVEMCATGGKIYTAAREICRETQVGFARRLDMSQAAISKKENGFGATRRPVLPRTSTLLDMAQKSGCRLSLVLCHPEVA